MQQQFLVHDQGDSVGVAVQDLAPGSPAHGKYQISGDGLDVAVQDPVPLGHKIALLDIPKGSPVVKYGITIGLATSDISTGQHVHVHNLKGQRWV